MRPSKTLLAVLVVAGVGALAWDAARPRVHPIKAADARKYSIALATPVDPADPRSDLFGRASAIDGDTLLIQGVEADLWTIDAPELAQTCDKDGRSWACGDASRAHLEQLIGGRQVACRPEGPPTEDGRWLGICFVTDIPCQGDTGPCESDLESLNLAQVTDGWAADIEGQYMDSETDAQDRKAGLWAGRFESPRDWRARQAPANP
ncbi:MAG: thermonuclease family protein [Pseudomonadota bacterium]